MSDSVSITSRILFVDDDADVRKTAQLLLARYGFELIGAANPEEAWSVLAAGPVDAVLLDLNFGPGAVTGAEGLRCLQGLVANDPDVVVIVVTGHSGIKIAVEAMRAGATDFVMKPWNNNRLIEILQDAVALRRRRAAKIEAKHSDNAEPFLAVSTALRQAETLALRTAPTDAAALILGEAGTGKTLLAQNLHRRSRRGGLGFTMLDPAAAWAEGGNALAEILATADPSGTLCLDITSLWPASLQTRLLSFITVHPNLRLIATSRFTAVALQESLNAELFFRLGTIAIGLPPLRGHVEDITALSAHFLRLYARRYQHQIPQLSSEAEAALINASWPGNGRELRQAIERAVVLSPSSTLQPSDLLQTAPLAADPGESDLNLLRNERTVVQEALKRHGFNVSRAARELGLTRTALYRRMARHGI